MSSDTVDNVKENHVVSPTSLVLPGFSGMNMSALVDYGKNLSHQVTTLVSQSSSLGNVIDSGRGILDWNNADSGNEFVQKVSAAFEHQHRINEANARYNKINAMVNFANSMRHRDISAIVDFGRRKLIELSATVYGQRSIIEDLEDSIRSLSSKLEVQGRETSEMRETLEVNTNLLNTSIQQQLIDREKHRAALDAQHVVLQRLLSRRLKQDFIVDSGLVICGLWLVNSLMFDIPLRIMLLALVRRERIRSWLRQTLKFIALIMFIRQGRIRASQLGVHSSTGTFTAYSHRVVKSIVATLFRAAPISIRRLINLSFENSSEEVSSPLSQFPLHNL